MPTLNICETIMVLQAMGGGDEILLVHIVKFDRFLPDVTCTRVVDARYAILKIWERVGHKY